MAAKVLKIEVDLKNTNRVTTIQRKILQSWNRWEHIQSMWSDKRSRFPAAVFRPFKIYAMYNEEVGISLQNVDIVSDIVDTDMDTSDIETYITWSEVNFSDDQVKISPARCDEFHDNSSNAPEIPLPLMHEKTLTRWSVIYPPTCLLVVADTEKKIKEMLEYTANSTSTFFLRNAVGIVKESQQDSVLHRGVNIQIVRYSDTLLKDHILSVLYAPFVQFLDNCIRQTWSLFLEHDEECLQIQNNHEKDCFAQVLRRDIHDIFLETTNLQQSIFRQILEPHRIECFQPIRTLSIPNEIKREIMSLPEVKGISFQFGRLKVILYENDRRKRNKIERTLREILRKREVELDITTEVSMTDRTPFAQISEGTKIMDNVRNDPEKYGTLGMILKVDQKKVIAITAAHVLIQGRDVYLPTAPNKLKIGTCSWSTYEIGNFDSEGPNQSLSDFAIIDIDDNIHHDVSFEFKTDDDQTLPLLIPNNEDISNVVGETVFKRGAKSKLTEGLISEVEEYNVNAIQPINNQQNMASADVELIKIFVVHGKDGITFSKPGDSGAVTFSIDDYRETIRIIAIIQAGVENENISLCSSFFDCMKRFEKATGRSLDLQTENI